jgi:hypothetical protein
MYGGAHQPNQGEPRKVQLLVEIDPGSRPIQGSVSGSSGIRRGFTGWLELAAEIEMAHTRPQQSVERVGEMAVRTSAER